MPEAIETLMQIIRERRSVRKFTGEPVTRDEVETILEAGRWAPSGLNNQPWKFLALFAGDARQEDLAGCTKYAPIVKNATSLVAVFLDMEKTYNTMKDHQAVGSAIQNMLLAAHGLGLGGVWLGEICNQADQVMQVLRLDGARYEFQALLAFGRPAASGASSRRPLNDFLLEELP